jgi:hypothetical protein
MNSYPIISALILTLFIYVLELFKIRYHSTKNIDFFLGHFICITAMAFIWDAPLCGIISSIALILSWPTINTYKWRTGLFFPERHRNTRLDRWHLLFSAPSSYVIEVGCILSIAPIWPLRYGLTKTQMAIYLYFIALSYIMKVSIWRNPKIRPPTWN